MDPTWFSCPPVSLCSSRLRERENRDAEIHPSLIALFAVFFSVPSVTPW